MTGLEPRPGQRIAIMSFSTKHAPGAAIAKTAADGVMHTAEDLHHTGEAFNNGLYELNPKRVIQSFATEHKHIGALERVKYIAQIAKPIDRTDPKQQALLSSGKLRIVNTHSDVAGRIHELAQFATQRLVPVAEAAGDAKSLHMAELLKNWADAIEGGGLAVPTEALKELTRQTTEATNWLQEMLAKPTQFWRSMTLSLKGSFYSNNFLGNLLMGLVSYGPQYLKELFTSGFAFTDMGKVIDEHAPGIARSGQLGTLRDEMRTVERTGKIGKAIDTAGKVNPLSLVNRLGDKFAAVGAKFTENNFRRAAFAVVLKKTAHDLARNEGISTSSAITKLLNDADSVDAMAEKVYGDMLDYTKLTPFEKNVLRTVYPFWNFQRAIIGRSVRLSLDEPWKVEVMKALSKTSLDQSNKMFGGVSADNVPEYLRGLLPIGPTVAGKTPVYSTYAANPFSTVADTLNTVAAPFTGQANAESSPISQWNPYLRSAFEAATGRDTFHGQPLPGTGAQVFAHQLAMNFPLYAAYDRARYPNENSMVRRTLAQSGEQYAGLPVGTFDASSLQRSLAIGNTYARQAAAAAQKAKLKREKRDIGEWLGLAG